jgi:hypothetical protein
MPPVQADQTYEQPLAEIAHATITRSTRIAQINWKNCTR